MGRNSDVNGKSMRRDDPVCNIDWSHNNPLVVNTIKNLTRDPISTLYLHFIQTGEIPNDLIEAMVKLNNSAKPGSHIDLASLPVQYRLIEPGETNQYNVLSQILNAACCKEKARIGNVRMQQITDGKYKRLKIYRIMKCASSALQSLRSAIIGEKERFCSDLFSQGDRRKEWYGYVGTNGMVEYSWSPLGYRCNAFNFAQSHFPIHEFNKYPVDTYTMVSLRDPLERIASFFNMTRQQGIWKSVEDFVDNCHPSFIAGQLYFCHQSNNLENAKAELRGISRVLIVEESSNWAEQISSDLCQVIEIPSVNKGKYQEEKGGLIKTIEGLISSHTELKSLVDDEYSLYNYAKTLST